MAKRKSTKKPAAHCKRVKKATGKTQLMCWNAKGKLTSAARVKGAKK